MSGEQAATPGSLLSGARAVSTVRALAFPLACPPRRHATPWHVLDCRVAAHPLATVRTADMAPTAARLSEVLLATPGNLRLVPPTVRACSGSRSVRPTTRRVAAFGASAALLTELAAAMLSSRLGTRPRHLVAPSTSSASSGASARLRRGLCRVAPCQARLQRPSVRAFPARAPKGSARRPPKCRLSSGRSARPAPPCALALA